MDGKTATNSLSRPFVYSMMVFFISCNTANYILAKFTDLQEVTTVDGTV